MVQRYRTVDQFNIYGQRSKIGYESGKGGPKFTNADLLHPEMAVRDVMTENRDQRVWAVARGGDVKVDDSNVPKVPEIKSNKPGPNPDGSWPYLSGQEAIKHMKLPAGCKVELVASEEQFPELVNPIQRRPRVSQFICTGFTNSGNCSSLATNSTLQPAGNFMCLIASCPLR